MMNLNADLLADAVAIAIRLERISMKCQHDADNDADIEWAKALRRHAIGLRDVIEQWLAKVPAVEAPTT